MKCEHKKVNLLYILYIVIDYYHILYVWILLTYALKTLVKDS